jgi:lysophospholipase L1-like esterase
VNRNSRTGFSLLEVAAGLLAIPRHAAERLRGARVAHVLGWMFPVIVLVSASSPASAIRIGLIGDSITAGNVAPDGSGGEPFAEQLVSLLPEDFEVLNFGVGGTTTVDWRPDSGTGLFQSVEDSLPLDVVNILLGSGDSLFLGLDPFSYAVGIKLIFDELLASGVSFVVLTAPPAHPGSQDADNPTNVRLQQYGDALRVLCASERSLVCGPDLFELLTPEDHFVNPGLGLQSDPHPNELGHTLIAQSLAETLLTIPEPKTGLIFGAGMVVLALRRAHGRQSPAGRRHRSPLSSCATTSRRDGRESGSARWSATVVDGNR